MGTWDSNDGRLIDGGCEERKVWVQCACWLERYVRL